MDQPIYLYFLDLSLTLIFLLFNLVRVYWVLRVRRVYWVHGVHWVVGFVEFIWFFGFFGLVGLLSLRIGYWSLGRKLLTNLLTEYNLEGKVGGNYVSAPQIVGQIGVVYFEESNIDACTEGKTEPLFSEPFIDPAPKMK